jgi:hypothetical protein
LILIRHFVSETDDFRQLSSSEFNGAARSRPAQECSGKGELSKVKAARQATKTTNTFISALCKRWLSIRVAERECYSKGETDREAH